jgi:DNA invertase Pin-like site-specific DNA recombinase
MSKLRAVAYVRVSQEREGMISPELQLSSIQAHCERFGYEVVETLQDLDLSGRFWKRRQVETAVKMIEAREADVIVVWKISRVARNRTDWAIAVDRVEGVGGRLESSTEPMDTTTSSGRFARGMLAELAVFESERIGDTWKETHARRVKNGLPHHGLPRFGYTYSKEAGYAPDEAAGPILREMYLRYSRGSSLRDLGAYAASEGFAPESGWRDGGIRHMLDRGFGAGYIWSKGEFLSGAHEGVITEREWQAYRVKRDERAARSTGGPNTGGVYVYSSLLRCFCGAKMDGGAVKRNGRTFRRYTCRNGLVKGTHAKVSVSENYVEDAVLAWLETVAAEIDAKASTIEPPKPKNTGRHAGHLRSDLKKNMARSDSLTLKYIDGDIHTDNYRRLLEALGDEKRALEARLRLVEVNSEVKQAVVVPQLLENWPHLPDRGKREILTKLVATIQLHDWENGVRSGRRRLEIVEHDWDEPQ